MTTFTDADALAAIRKLPQAALIPNDRAIAWLQRTRRVENDRLAWHIRRASGIGSSEIGTLVGARNGIDTYDTPGDVVKDKLLITSPDGGTKHTQRGIRAEPFVRDYFIQMMSARGVAVRRDEEAFALLSQTRHPDHAWMIGSPDDILIIGGERWLIDYKVPKTPILEGYRKEGTPLTYTCQLHHFGILARTAGIELDGMANVFFDLEAWEPEMWAVPHDPDYDREILAAGDHCWAEWVMRGVIPKVEPKPLLEVEGGVPDDLQTMADEYVRIALLEGQLKGRKEELREQIGREIRELGQLEGAKLPLSRGKLLEVTAKPLPDVETMVEQLGARGGDPEACRGAGKILDIDGVKKALKERKLKFKDFQTQEGLARERLLAALVAEGFEATKVEAVLQAAGRDLAEFRLPGDYDVAKLKAALVEVGLDPERMVTETFTLALPRTEKGPLAELVSDLKGIAFERMREMLDALPVSYDDLAEKPETPQP